MATLIASKTDVPLAQLLCPTGFLRLAVVAGFAFLPQTRGTDWNA